MKRTWEGSSRRFRRAWLVGTEKMARSAGIYRLLDWMTSKLKEKE